MGLTEEQKAVAKTFYDSFASEIFTSKFILYGIGKNTDAILHHERADCVAGLMDQNTIGQTIYDRRVFSMEEVAEMDPKPIVVIVARNSVVDIIFRRIESLWTDHGITICDCMGNDLTKRKATYRNGDLPYWNVSYDDLCGAIRSADIVSFDIFDTLLMRKCLLPTDVFFLVEEQLRGNGMEVPYAQWRRAAEREAGVCCSFDQIYEKMQQMYGVSDSDIGMMKTLELAAERKLLFVRKRMVDAFYYAIEQGKKVYILSDMYYSKSVLSSFLEENGIAGYRDLFVSCEIACRKEDGDAYSWYLAQVGEGKKLHIGDNRIADIEKAKEKGLDTFQILSGYELLQASSLQGLLADVSAIEKRNMLGLITAHFFENPFSMCGSGGVLSVDNMDTLGFGFAAPILFVFVCWMDRVISEEHIDYMLFPSRDGYLVQKIYQCIAEDTVPNAYFRASRRAVTVASLKTLDDIRCLAGRNFSGSCGDFLETRFGVTMRYDDPRKDKRFDREFTERLISDYKNEILAQAEFERVQYEKYLKEYFLEKYAKLGVFDFVAGGTVQFYLEKLLGKKLQGIYAATMNLPNEMYSMDSPDIFSAAGNITSYGGKGALGKYYLLLETILVDDKPTFSHFDSEMNEVFETGKANPEKTEKIQTLQDGVLRFVRAYVDLFGSASIGQRTDAMLEWADQLYGMLFSDSCKVSGSVREVFVNDDVFGGVGEYQVW